MRIQICRNIFPDAKYVPEKVKGIESAAQGKIRSGFLVNYFTPWEK